MRILFLLKKLALPIFSGTVRAVRFGENIKSYENVTLDSEIRSKIL